MPRFRVRGASSQTGEDTSIEVTADTVQDAESIAQGRGILVSGVEELRATSHATLPPRVEVKTSNTPALTLGIISIVLAVLALLVGWVPFLGLVAIPAAVLAGLLAFVGLILAAAKGLRGVSMPALGLVLSIGAGALPLASTIGGSAAIGEASLQLAEEIDAARAELEAERAREEAQAESARARQEAEIQAYIDESIELYDVSAEYRESVLDGEVPGVLFKLRNTGDRSLDMVEVTVYFHDVNGGIIYEEDFLPVLVNEYSFGRDNKPLKAGYVWQMESGRFYSAKSVPAEWAEGAFTARVTDLRFSESE